MTIKSIVVGSMNLDFQSISSISRVLLVVSTALFTTLTGLAQEAPSQGYPLPDPSEGDDVVSKCGPNIELQDVERYDGSLGVSRRYVAGHEPSTIQFQWLPASEILARLAQQFPNSQHSAGTVGGKRWCTGTLIGPDTVLTAAHCFQEEVNGWDTPDLLDANGKLSSALPSVLAPLFQVHFNYQLPETSNQARTPDTFPVLALLEYGFDKTKESDYALVRIGRNAAGQLPGALGYTPALIAARPVATTERLTIIQHPKGQPKLIGSGNVHGTKQTRLLYDTIDTFNGSSGSGVRDENGVVVAVHVQGGCQEVGPGENKGVLLEHIAEVSDLL